MTFSGEMIASLEDIPLERNDRRTAAQGVLLNSANHQGFNPTYSNNTGMVRTAAQRQPPQRVRGAFTIPIAHIAARQQQLSEGVGSGLVP